MNPNSALRKFRDTFAPELDYNDPKLFHLMLSEINKLKENVT